ncbi:TadE family type IV pilus minor pilin [Streptomyces sp. NPDC005481]|uniref:TadE family type IV pilus minor pilin n=1 Tax=Streptomyces sp. NPDC005481 TaxID=3154881 RepID=UPI0033ADB51B
MTRDRGFVTAETAVMLPALVLFAMALVWALLAASAQIQCVDAARAGARAAARQDPPEAVAAVARRAAPGGARVTVRREGDLVHVTVAAHPPGPDGLTLELRHEAVALAEETVGTVGSGGVVGVAGVTRTTGVIETGGVAGIGGRLG